MERAIFITGAGGYLGQRLLQWIDTTTYDRVYCLSRKPRQPLPKLHWITADLLDSGHYAPQLFGCETVLHLAAATGKHSRAVHFLVNREGTQVLVDAARKAGVGKILYVSTVAAGFPRQVGYHYAQSKKQAEDIVAASGLQYLIVRPTMILGPAAPVWKGLVKLAGAPVIPVFGSGLTAVQPVYVDDLARCLLSALENDFFPNAVCGAGGPDVLSIEELLIRIRQSYHRRPARAVHIPVDALLPVLRALETFLLPFLPITAGQLMSFVNDGTIGNNAFMERSHPRMVGIDEMLRLAGRPFEAGC
jgi:NADH dehydrogenase